METKESLVAHIQTKLTPPVSMESLMIVPILVPSTKIISECIEIFSDISSAPVVDSENVILFYIFIFFFYLILFNFLILESYWDCRQKKYLSSYRTGTRK